MMRIAIRCLAAAFAWICISIPANAAVEIAEVTSPGGIKAWLVEEHAIPFTALEIRFRGGAILDAPDKRGATSLMMSVLEEGAGDLDARAFGKKVEELSARFGFETGDDTIRISARFLSENRDQAVELLRLALTDPRFDQDAVDRVRGQVLSIIQSDAQDPNKIASQAFDQAAFGSHPYGKSRNGTVESVTALTREDMIEAKARTLTLDRIYIGAVGDITAEEFGNLLDELLGDLPKTGAPLPAETEFLPEGGVEVIDLDTPQSVTIFGHRGIKRDDPEFFAAFVMNRILGGGGFTSRLTEEVREKRGLTYGISTFLVPMELAELYMGQVASSNATIKEAIDLIRVEWQRMVDEGVSAEELRDAQTYLTGAYPLRFDGNAQIANILAGMQLQGLGIDYIATRNDKVNAVTREDIQRVAQRLLNPDDLFFVVVGQPEGL